VTGASGFLGTHIVERARRDGLEIVAAYRNTSVPGAVSLDVRNPASVDAAFRTAAPSIVIHCAAYGVNYAEQDADQALAVNTHGSLCALAAAARHGVRRFVHIGSCFEYGSHAGPISEDAVPNPTAIYGATKAAATILVRERAHALGIPLVIARPFGLWGPGEAAYRVIPQVIAACLSGTPLKLTACNVTRDYTYVEDMASNILALALTETIEPGALLNIATGRPLLLREFVLSAARLLGGESLMQFGALPYRPTEMSSLVADVSRMRQALGERPETPLSDGVRRMVDEYHRRVAAA
jgi:nucleoside-diphosphate-sugar epimerase